jgi:cytochrome c-type biogenesis protein CcmF
MLGELGHFALILALVVAVAQCVIPLIGAHRGMPAWIGLAPVAATVQFLAIATAFGVLTYGYITSDFSIANVFQNSHTEKPLLYRISGVWGNHEGSLVLWVLILALFGQAVVVFGRDLPASFRARVLSVQAFIAAGFLLFSLLTSNPFLRLDPVPLQGRGLNPLLQDPGLAFHPPFLYLGYVGFSIAFSFAIAALLEGKVDAVWARWVRPWTLAAWCFLTIGITLGSWWAYYELGWGGWWFWDPVENASFMPWLAGTALLHSALVVEKRDALKNWTILLAIITFSLSLLGTFLVRSGVLTSVHAFASDPARGVFILAFFGVVVIGSLSLYALRAPSMQSGGAFAPISREGMLIVNNLFLATACATVLLGTLYPLFLDAVAGTKVSVGPPFFNKTFGRLMLPVLFLLVLAPLMPWKRADLAGALARLTVAGLSALAAVAAVWIYFERGPWLALAGVWLGTWVVMGALTDLAGRIGLFKISPLRSLRRLIGLPGSAWAVAFAHGGVGVALLGIVAVSAWDQETLTVMRPGEKITVAGYDLTFQGARPLAGPNYSAIRGKFKVTRDGRFLEILQPEHRSYANPPMDTTEAAIRSRLTGDLYAVIGDPTGDGAWSVRIYHKPLISWLWLGAGLMVFGGLLSLLGRWRVSKKFRSRSDRNVAGGDVAGDDGDTVPAAAGGT